MLETRIEGAAQFKRLAAQIRKAGNEDLGKEMAQALNRVAEPIKVEVTKETLASMPSEGGYQALMSKSLKHRISRRVAGKTAQLLVRTYADGTNERRDIQRLNKGELRHPVYGRSRRIKVGVRKGTIIKNPWSVTEIRGDFYRRGTDRAGAVAQKELMVVLEDLAERMVK